MRTTTNLPVLVALGATAFVASIVAAVWLADARWLVVGVAALLVCSFWSATRSGGSNGQQ